MKIYRMNNLSTVINKDNYSHSNHLILTLFFYNGQMNDNPMSTSGAITLITALSNNPNSTITNLELQVGA